MSQYLSVGWFKAIGIVPALFIMGLVLCKLKVMVWLGSITIFVSIVIGVIYGVLGIFGILKNMEFIEIKKAVISMEDFKIRKKQEK